MGCDGGTIPKRDELVRTKKKPEQKDKDAELSYRWRHCSINQQPLQKPIVACQLGRLYSKTSVLEGLLDRTTLPETATHIKSLKCQKQYEDEDIVILNAANEDLDVMTERMVLRQQEMKAEKKAKKAKVKSESGEGGSDTQALQNGGSEAKNGVNGASASCGSSSSNGLRSSVASSSNGTGKRPMTTVRKFRIQK
ncbi:replication termination factor 2-like [Nilaparvata lugens]|uniref:replication termination factor 2-like n=1 Tax=Nilaparvata lugens TaxID=108931 RepID=UPI00193E0C67|nr:replication termination factor 2-like [Nilaparvata lugens]